MPIVIFGLSGSGKNTLADYLVESYGAHRVVTYTTREPRKGEIDGIDYNFIPFEIFQELIESDFFAEYDTFYPDSNPQFYGTSKTSLSRDKSILILTPSGIKKLLEQGCSMRLVYLNEGQETCIRRLAARGDKIEEVARRMTYDLPIFRDFEVYLKTNNIPYLEFNSMTLEEMGERIEETWLKKS